MPRSVDCRTATAPADVDAAFGKSECGDANAIEFADHSEAASACTNPVAHSTINEIIFESPSAGSRASMPVHSASEALHVSAASQNSMATSGEEPRRLIEMRRKIAELDKVNELERQRLEEEQREVEERRRQQEEFERELQKRTEREMEEHRAREAEAEHERFLREQEQQREYQERGRRRKEQLKEEQQRSKRLEEQRREGRSEATQLRWAMFEEELDKQWAEQEAEERRRIHQYAKDRQRLHKDWDRSFASERQKFASEAEHTEAARRRRHARSTANADEQFYGPHRCRGFGAAAGSSAPPKPPPPQTPKPPAVPRSAMNAEECAILKELQSVQHVSRDSQKAKVKELLFRWHPDKNPTCVEKATRIFQFVQRQRELVLGL